MQTISHYSTRDHFHGGGERARTDDLLRAKQVLSQLSYTPEKASLLLLANSQ